VWSLASEPHWISRDASSISHRNRARTIVLLFERSRYSGFEGYGLGVWHIYTYILKSRLAFDLGKGTEYKSGDNPSAM